jgi:iron(III) transport system substrate-binding protein
MLQHMVDHPRRRRIGLLLALVGLLPAGCRADPAASSQGPAPVTLYTCVSDSTIQPVITEYKAAHPGAQINLFRAPTGELNARVAADLRSGGLKADVIWGCDPLTMQGYVDQQLVGGWTPQNAADIPRHYRTDSFVGVAVLYLVAVHRRGTPAPASWSDLTDPGYAPVAVPDPRVAASALGALGYFGNAKGYGTDFYRALKQNGANQVSTPDLVTTGVAQGLYQAGMTTANSAYLAKSKGSPVEVSWPQPGAVAVYGPIGLAQHGRDSQPAKDFITYVVSEPGQQVVATAGSYPTRPDVTGGPEIPSGAPVVQPDWPAVSADRDQLLDGYQSIFGS